MNLKFLIITGVKADVWSAYFVYGLKKRFGYTDNNFIYVNWKKIYDFKPQKLADVCIAWSASQLGDWVKYADNVIIEENAFLTYDSKPHPFKQWASFGWNGSINRANYCNKNSKSYRWDTIFAPMDLLSPYSGGSYVLLLTQCFSDFALLYLNENTYYDIVVEIRKYTDMPIYVRYHPSDINPNGWNMPEYVKKSTAKTLKEALIDAKVVVTVNSTGGVESILAGKPVISVDKSSMVWDISEHSFEKINYPPFHDRTQWLYDISYCQWNIDEVKNGDTWNHLKQIYYE